MKVVIQRVNKSSVEINNKIKSEIQKGLLVLIGIGLDDDKKDAEWLANKVLNFLYMSILLRLVKIRLMIR